MVHASFTGIQSGQEGLGNVDIQFVDKNMECLDLLFLWDGSLGPDNDGLPLKTHWNVFNAVGDRVFEELCIH